ncbi:MAG TPA: TonB-dependent receptor [Bacteroidia bacterium]|nr:TonB-dependent receptor [Bacteroidia bacterium]
MRFSLVLLLTLWSFGVWSQKGTIAGTVTEKDNNDAPAYGAIVRIDSTSLGAPADFDGKFEIKVPPGTYSVSCKYTGYAPVVVKNVVVTAGKTTTVDFPLEKAAQLVGNDTSGFVTIVGIKPTQSQATVLKDIQEGNNATDGQGQGEIKKSTSTDAGQVARRIPGVTLVDNRFIIIRGLSERYNSVLLNNVLAPSVESDVKAFSFNLIPAPMIDRFMVTKSPSADLPGEFAGGVVRLTTTDIPQQTSLNLNYQFGYRSGTTFEPFQANRVGTRDAYGLGLKSRELPADFPANIRNPMLSPAALQTVGQSLQNTWGYETSDANPDQRFNLTLSYRLSKPKFQFGNITSINYSNTNSYWNQKRYDYYAFSPGATHSDTLINYDDANYVNSVRIAFVQNNAFRFGKAGQHRFTVKNLFNQLGDNENSFRTGSNFEDGEYRHEYSFHYVQRTIYTGQIGAEHDFNNKRTRLDYTLAYSLGRRNDPDWKRARYYSPFSAGPDDPYFLYVPNSAQPFYLSRIYVAMDEHTMAGSMNLEQDITIGKDSVAKKDGFTFTVKAGAYIESKERHFGVRNIGYKGGSFQTYGNYALLTTTIDQIFSPENVNNVDGFAIDEDTKPSDSYFATNNLQAGYAMVLLPFGSFKGKTDGEKHERVRVSAGVRLEHNVQQLNSNKQNGDTVIVNNDKLNTLPSLNIAYNFTDRMLVRAAYGKTLNRPEFREIAPLYFYDFISNSINVGNDSLQTAEIDNVDLRWEFYPRPGENITVGVFYKRFKNPIEMYFVPGVGAGGIRSFTWDNAPLATSYGIEFEIRKKLDSVNVPVIRNLSIVANAAYIYSEITLSSTYTGPQANKRPMMGQSPWIVNAGLFWQTDSSGWQVNVMYNVIGPRVVVVGVLDVPEIYEMPRHQLDLSIVKTLGKNKNIDIRLNITDLLNQETLLMQDEDANGLDRKTDNIMSSFKRGTYVTFGVTVRLFEPKTN